MSNVLITGGTGFIGSQLALACCAAGDAVRVLGRRRSAVEESNARAAEGVGAQVIDASVTDAAAVRDACAGAEVVYHLAAAQHEANVPDEHFRSVNVGGARHVLEAAEAQGARVVHGSTIGVFNTDGPWPTTERSALTPLNIYGITKLEAERVVEKFRARVPVTIVRISETYGPGDRRLLKLFRALLSGRFARIGPGRNLHHPVYIDDLVAGLRTAAALPGAPDEPVVLAGFDALTSDDMITAIAEAVGRTPPRMRLPLWPLSATAAVLETVLRPLGVQPPLHRRRLDFFVRSFRFDLSPAERALGFRPQISFRDGAARTAAWYRSQGLLGHTPQAGSA